MLLLGVADGAVLSSLVLPQRRLLEISPHRLGPPIGAGDPGRGTRVDPTVECLVALAQLLPLETAEAALRLLKVATAMAYGRAP